MEHISLGLFLMNTLLYYGHAEDAVLTIDPNWSTFFIGEYVTFTCDMKDGEDTDWFKKINKDGRELFPYGTNKDFLFRIDRGSGLYQCHAEHIASREIKYSNNISLTVSADKPKPTLTKHTTVIRARSIVTLTCDVKGSSSWKYDWFRRHSDTGEAPVFNDENQNKQISVSQGGIYRCRGSRGNPPFSTDISDEVTVEMRLSNRAVVTLQSNWPEIYFGAAFTLRCDIKDGGDTEWEYEWTTPRSNPLAQRQNEYWVSFAQPSDSGEYRCKGRRKNDQFSTEWSDAFNLTVLDRPVPVLTVSPLWLSPGDSVTLRCEVKHPSAGWRFYWYEAVPRISDNYYTDKLLPGSTKGTEQDSYIINEPMHTAGYRCRAGRGDPVYYTHYSLPKFVWSGDVHSTASLTVSPDRVQHFYSSDSVSLSCEGNSTEWKVMRFNKYGYRGHCSNWGTMTGSTCNIRGSQYIDDVFWCESGSGHFSNAVNITARNAVIILVSPVYPVTEGHSVTLGCKLKTEKTLSKVFFYQNDKLIQNDSRRELTIPAVSRSDEGFYKCRVEASTRRWASSESWMSVRSITQSEDSFPVLLIVGLVCGIVLIILLLLVCRYKQSKDFCLTRSQRTNQGSATEHVINQDETQQNKAPYDGLYESVKGSKITGNDESMDVTYSSIMLKDITKKGKRHEPVESSIYSDVKTGSAAVYAQVHSHNKGRLNPAAAEEPVYSEVKKGTTLGL